VGREGRTPWEEEGHDLIFNDSSALASMAGIAERPARLAPVASVPDLRPTLCGSFVELFPDPLGLAGEFYSA
jgi:hypothetical protein